jgi:NADH:ubiquinone oxidoreductase subunit 6 (subunit J)
MIISTLIIISAIATQAFALTRPIHASPYLVLAYINTTIYPMGKGLEFIGIFITIVYVGALAILSPLVLMLLNIGGSEARNGEKANSGGGIGNMTLIPLAITVALLIVESMRGAGRKKAEHEEDMIGIEWEEKSGKGIARIKEAQVDIEIIGEKVYTENGIAFIIAGSALLVAVHGIVGALRKKGVEEEKPRQE